MLNIKLKICVLLITTDLLLQVPIYHFLSFVYLGSMNICMFQIISDLDVRNNSVAIFVLTQVVDCRISSLMVVIVYITSLTATKAFDGIHHCLICC